MKRLTAIAAGLLASPLAASAGPIQVAPFTSPQTITIPRNIPSGGVKPGVYRRSDSLMSQRKPSERQDTYIGPVRRRGNIVSFYAILRRLKKPTPKLNQSNASEFYMGGGTFLPDYWTRLQRYDCANDSSMSIITPVNIITAAGGSKGWMMSDRSGTKSIPIPNQVRITIEGYPYWASHDRDNWEMRGFSRDKPEWISVNPGTNGAAHLDAACDSKL